MTEENKNTDSKQENNQDVQNTQESQESQETQSEIKEPDVVTVTPGLEGPSPGVLQKIRDALKKKPKEEDKLADETEGGTGDKVGDVVIDKDNKQDLSNDFKDSSEDKLGTSEEKYEYEEIDQRFVDAAELYGWSKERIIEYAEYHDDMDVVEMTTRMEKSIKDNRASSNKPDKSISSDSFINEEALKTLAEDSPEIAQAVKGLFDPLAKRFEDTSSELKALKGTLGNYESDRKAQDSVRDMETANRIFDSSGVSSLGKTKDIPKYPDGSLDTKDPVVQERQKVWGVAQQFYANGGTFEGALKNAMQWYHGSNANKDVKHKIIKELKEQEERIMPKRQESKVEKVYASEEERKAAIIDDARRKYSR